jgi:hypothetical protein
MAVKREELDYMRRALDALDDPETTAMGAAKILRTLSQIADRASREIEQKFVDRVDQNLANQYLVDKLKQSK